MFRHNLFHGWTQYTIDIREDLTLCAYSSRIDELNSISLTSSSWASSKTKAGVLAAMRDNAGRRHSVAEPSFSSVTVNWKRVQRNHMLRNKATSSEDEPKRGLRSAWPRSASMGRRRETSCSDRSSAFMWRF